MRETLSYFYVAMVLVALSWVMGMYVIGEKPKKEKTATHAKKDPLKNSGTNKDSKEPKKQEADKSTPQKGVDQKQGSELTKTPTAKQTDRKVPNSEVSDQDYFVSLKNTYLSPIVASLPEGRSREDVIVRYYKHTKDREKVYALKSLGYYLHEREAEDSKDFASNVLYYGNDVNVEDIKIVAYTLLESGVELKDIQPSQYEWKFHALEVGADSLLASKPKLTLADVRNFQLN